MQFLERDRPGEPGEIRRLRLVEQLAIGRVGQRIEDFDECGIEHDEERDGEREDRLQPGFEPVPGSESVARQPTGSAETDQGHDGCDERDRDHLAPVSACRVRCDDEQAADDCDCAPQRSTGSSPRRQEQHARQRRDGKEQLHESHSRTTILVASRGSFARERVRPIHAAGGGSAALPPQGRSFPRRQNQKKSSCLAPLRLAAPSCRPRRGKARPDVRPPQRVVREAQSVVSRQAGRDPD
jgi:hypothetical protein